MKVVGTPINAATDPVLLDPRDYARLRARMLELEERMLKVENEQLAADITIKNLVGEVRDQRKLVLDLQRQFALFMSGTKERFDVLGLLLPQSETPVDRKDVG